MAASKAIEIMAIVKNWLTLLINPDIGVDSSTDW